MQIPFSKILVALGMGSLGDLFKKGRLRQSQRNAAVGGLTALINPVVQFVATPLIFHKLGATSFGVWALITSVIAVSGLANMGLGDGATKYVALYRARKDWDGVDRVIRSTLTLYLGLGALALVVVLAAAPWISNSLFHVDANEVNEAIPALRVASLGIVARLLYGVSEAAVRGYERYDIEAMWATINAVMTSLITVICVYLGGGLTSIVLSGIVMTLICAIGLSFVLTRLTGSWKWAAPSLDKAAAREVFGFGIFSWMQNLNGLVMLQLDRVVIGAWLGAAAAGYYSVCLQLVQTAHGVLSRTCNFLFPLVVKHREDGNHEGMWSLFKEGMMISTVAGWLLSSVFIVFGHLFLQLWMGTEFATRAGSVLVVLGIYNAFLATTIVPTYFLNATGREKLCTALGAMSTASFLIAAFFLIRPLGTVGAAGARLFNTWTCLVCGAMLIRSLSGDRRWYSGVVTVVPTTAAVLVVWLFDIIVPAPYAAAWTLRLAILLIATATCGGLAVFVYRRYLRFGPERGSEGDVRVLIDLDEVGKVGDA